MPLQRLELLAVFEADDVIRRDGLLHGDRRLRSFRGHLYGAAPDTQKSRMDVIDQRRQVARRNRIIADVSGDDIRSQLNVVRSSDVVAHFDFLPFRLFRMAQKSISTYV